METRANYVVVGTFVLVIIVAAFGSIIWLFGQNVREEAGGYYDIYFSGSVVGLGRDSKVRMSGVDIGLVREVRLRETGLVRVNVQIEKQYLPNIRQDSVAELASESFVTAIPYVEISPGSSGAPPLEPSGEQRSQIPSKPSTLESLENRLPEVISKLETIADRVSDVLDERNRAAIAAILQNTEQLTDTLNKAAPKIGGFIDDFDDAVKQAKTALVTADMALHTADDVLHDAKNTLHNTDNLEAHVDVTLREFDAAAQHIDQLIQENRPGIRDFTQGGLTDLRRLISDTRVLVAGLTRVASELERDPSRFIWGDRREGYHPR
jgi:phospholipid/cholesterol/gamma-HCH transport system substrate-binding protein